MKEPPLIACDIDGVLADPLGPLLDWIQDAFCVAIAPEDVTHWDNVLNVARNQSSSPITTEAWNAARRAFWTSPAVIGELPFVLPYRTALARVRGMTGGLHIVTERGDELLETSRAWLDSYGIPFDRIALRKDKAAYCRERRISYIIDDDPDVALSCQRTGVGVFLIDQPYNRAVPPLGGIWRVHAPLDIPGMLEHDLCRAMG